MNDYSLQARLLAGILARTRWNSVELERAAAGAAGKRWPTCARVIDELLHGLGNQRRPLAGDIAQWLMLNKGFGKSCRRYRLSFSHLDQFVGQMSPVRRDFASWKIPPLTGISALADFFGLTLGELDWLADLRGLERFTVTGKLRNYNYRWVSKRISGTCRLIESPKWRLKMVQRHMLHGILDYVPLHRSAHGFRQGRSIRSCSAIHVGKDVVLRMDLQDFFPSISRARIAGLFRAAGYPEDVSLTLAALATNLIPQDVWNSFPAYGSIADRYRHESIYGTAHLPQGAPTSPALANLCAYKLDCRLAGLAERMGGHYSRYADDLVLSGAVGFERCLPSLIPFVASICLEEGFVVNHRKTKIMGQAERQRLLGLVVNQKLNPPRDEYDRLRATLFNCVRFGPRSANRDGLENFRSHLLGRINFVTSINASRGQRLTKLFNQIDWIQDSSV